MAQGEQFFFPRFTTGGQVVDGAADILQRQTPPFPAAMPSLSFR